MKWGVSTRWKIRDMFAKSFVDQTRQVDSQVLYEAYGDSEKYEQGSKHPKSNMTKTNKQECDNKALVNC